MPVYQQVQYPLPAQHSPAFQTALHEQIHHQQPIIQPQFTETIH